MALDPTLLLLDEPLAGLNQNEARSLADLIRELNSGGAGYPADRTQFA